MAVCRTRQTSVGCSVLGLTSSYVNSLAVQSPNGSTTFRGFSGSDPADPVASLNQTFEVDSCLKL